MTGKGNHTKPFIKWAGGKGQLLSQLDALLPRRFGTYHEPFLGGGAVFFHLQPPGACLSDQNEELINAYRVVRDHVELLLESLKQHKNEKHYYYRIRSLAPEELDPIQRASRFIYLNKTCYNGLYRVNQKGRFNVPFGKYKNPAYADVQTLHAASRALDTTLCLEVADFATVLQRGASGDLIYFDPPYVPLTETANFTGYTTESFPVQEQHRLRQVYGELDQRGCYVMLSNSDTPTVRDLYRGFRFVKVKAKRFINRDGTKRGQIDELVILNY